MPALTNLYLAFLLAVCGNASIYAGLAFINGKLLPNVLNPFYNQVGLAGRTVVMTITASVIANYIFAKVYRLSDPAWGAALILIALILVMIAKSLLLGTGHMHPRLVLATAALMAAAAWVAFELHS